MVRSPSSLADFRESLYPGMGHFEEWEKQQRVRRKNMTTYDFQHCAKLLAHPEMKTWVEKEESGLLWVNSHQITKTVDWVSVLATNLIDRTTQLEYITLLRIFCFQSYSDKPGSSPCLVVQSLIFQVLHSHRKQFLNNRNIELTVQSLEDARQDLDHLWHIFLEVVKTAKMACVWIVIDHVDILTKETTVTEVLAFLAYLDNLVMDADLTVKVLITARLCGSQVLSGVAAESGAIDPRHPIINVPRGYHRHDALLLARQSKKPHRLHEAHPLSRRDVVDLTRSGKMSLSDHSDTSNPDRSPERQPKEQCLATRSEVPSSGQSCIEDSDSSSLPEKDILASSGAETSSSESNQRRKYHAHVKILRYSSSEDTSDDHLTLAVRPEIMPSQEFAWDTDDSDNDVLPRTQGAGSAALVALPNGSPKDFGHDSVFEVVGANDFISNSNAGKKVAKKVVTFDSDFDDSDA